MWLHPGSEEGASPATYLDNLNKGPCNFDVPHAFGSSYVWELPFGKGKRWATSGFSSKVAGGWQLNGLIATYSGTPFNVTASGTSLNAPGNTQRANLVKSNVAILGGAGPNQSYFDPLAFAPVTTASFDHMKK